MTSWQKDLALVFVSVIVAVLLVKTHALEHFLTATEDARVFGSFIAGIFFTSVFTIPIASVALGEIAQANSLLMVAFVGAFGALLGDLLLFSFAKNNLSKDIDLICKIGRGKRCTFLLRKGAWRYITPILGALIIASPLPDELGLAMMGISKVNVKALIPISYAMNFLGIVIVGLIARG